MVSGDILMCVLGALGGVGSVLGVFGRWCWGVLRVMGSF